MYYSIQNLTVAALDSIVDWAQSNKNYETMKIRVGDFLNITCGEEPTSSSHTDRLVHSAVRRGAAQALAFVSFGRIPLGRFIAVAKAMQDIASTNTVQQITTTINQSNNEQYGQ